MRHRRNPFARQVEGGIASAIGWLIVAGVALLLLGKDDPL